MKYFDVNKLQQFEGHSDEHLENYSRFIALRLRNLWHECNVWGVSNVLRTDSCVIFELLELAFVTKIFQNKSAHYRMERTAPSSAGEALKDQTKCQQERNGRWQTKNVVALRRDKLLTTWCALDCHSVTMVLRFDGPLLENYAALFLLLFDLLLICTLQCQTVNIQ